MHEVPLLQSDVARITSATGRPTSEFVDQAEGWLLLKGAGIDAGGCTFRGTVYPDGRPLMGCTIHEARPAACRTYPFVWKTEEEAKPFVDRDSSCPHVEAFEEPTQIPTQLESLWNQLNAEREARLD